MAFKEKMKKIGASIKTFWKKHKEEIVLVGGGLAITGAACYGAYKRQEERDMLLPETSNDTYEETVEDKTAWDKNWDEFGTNLEMLTHQPWGDLSKDDDEYVDPFDGNCFIVAGYNSLYNESPDQLKFYVLDNEGYYHLMPEDNYSA